MSKPATLEREEMNFEPKPGTTYKVISEEVQCLSEFMSMMKQKAELDKQHLTALEALQATWNPKWSSSSVYPLVSPFITYFNDEIAARAEANEYITLLLAGSHSISSSIPVAASGFDPADLPQCLESSNESYLVCHEVVAEPQAVAQLQTWLSRTQRSRSLRWGDVEGRNLPEQDRNYRRAVIQQQRSVEPAIKWYDEELPAILEWHQQRAEDLKKLLHRMLNATSQVSLQLSTSCATAINEMASFSSVEFVATHHDATEKERSHTLLEPKQYRNYYIDGRVARPLFGLGQAEILAVVQQNLPSVAQAVRNGELLALERVDIDMTFELETSALSEPVFNQGIYDFRDIRCLLKHSLCFDEPLIPISNENILKYRDGVPRNKLGSILKGIDSKLRPTILSFLCQFVGELGRYDSAIAFTHNYRATGIVLDICRKWDIENDRPLPDGSLRGWSAEYHEWILIK